VDGYDTGIAAMSTRRFLDRLFDHCDGGVVELRALPSTRRAWAVLGAWSSLGQFITTEVNQRENVYIGVATRKDTSSGTTDNLAQVPALFVDWDCSPADARARLAGFPFPVSLLVESGLGLHGYWVLKEPIDLHEPGKVHYTASLLRRLSAYLGADDRATDPARVLRLPGTVSYKYGEPRAVTLVHDNGQLVNSAEFDDFLPREVVRQNRMVLEASITAGARNDTLYSLARSLRAKRLGRPAIEAAVETANRTQCEPPLEDDEVRKLINHVMTQRDRADFVPPSPITIIHDAEPADGSTEMDVATDDPAGVVVNLATVQPESVHWLWPSWLPRKKAVSLAGDPGLGKSMLTIDLAARVTNGLPWPTGYDVAPRGRALFLCAEDGLADTVRPRLDAAGGDPRGVDVLIAVRTASGNRLVNLAADLRVLQQVVERSRPALIVIDPISAYLGNTDSYKDAEVRRVLAPLLAMVDAADAVLLWVAHLTKAAERKALYRPGASIAFIAAARVALIVGEHPDEPNQCVIAQPKNNLAPKAQSLSYSVQTGRVVWGETVRYNAEDLMRSTTSDDQELSFTAKGLIATIRQEHADGVIDVNDANARAELVGIPKRTLRHAARQAGLVPYHKGFGARKRDFWFDPERGGDAATIRAAMTAITTKGDGRDGT
jgi:hypothetical protein